VKGFFHTPSFAEVTGNYLIIQTTSDPGQELLHLQMKNIFS